MNAKKTKEIPEEVLFAYQMHIVFSDALKTVGGFIEANRESRNFIRHDIKQRMSALNRELNLYAAKINTNDSQLIGECGQFADIAIEFLNKATKDRKTFEEIVGLMSAYNNGEIKITED